jgi:hypothetical protein
MYIMLNYSYRSGNVDPQQRLAIAIYRSQQPRRSTGVIDKIEIRSARCSTVPVVYVKDRRPE